jgi:hypothetical protein
LGYGIPDPNPIISIADQVFAVNIMNLIIKSCAVLSSILVVAVSQAAGFTNGSFETNVFDHSGNAAWNTLQDGSTDISSWVVNSPDDGRGVDLSFDDAGWDVKSASDGHYMIDLNNAGISQTFDTIVGQQYVVSVDVANLNWGSPQELAALKIAAGLDSVTFTAPDSYFQDAQYSTAELTFTAVSSSTTLSLSSSNANGAWGAIVDNVQVEAVPEPISMTVLGVGALGLLRRRRKN